MGGGQIGVNYEFREGVVVGTEAMFDWLPNTTNTFNAIEGPGGPFPGTLASATFNNRWLTTATGKLGYAWDTVLLYGKVPGSEQTIRTLRSVGSVKRSPVAPPIISAGLPVLE